MENQKGFKISQYACAVLLIVSSIALVAYQVVKIDDVAGGLLYYVAQSFLLAGSIFGLDQYLRTSELLTNITMKENQNDMNAIDGVRLSPHFRLGEFLNLNKYPQNIPTMQVVANLTYGCHQLLEPARLMVGPIIVNSGFRCEAVNRKVGGVRNS